MRIYLASSWRNEQQPAVLEALTAAGHDVYDFRHPEPGKEGFGWKHATDTPQPWTNEQFLEVLKHPVAEKGFRLDMRALICADAVVMLQKCGVSAALELGIAIGMGKLTVVQLAEVSQPELMVKAAWKLTTSTEETVKALMGTPPTATEHGTFIDVNEANAFFRHGALFVRTSTRCDRCGSGVRLNRSCNCPGMTYDCAIMRGPYKARLGCSCCVE